MPEQPPPGSQRPPSDDPRASPPVAPVPDATPQPAPTRFVPQDGATGSPAGDSAARLTWLQQELGRQLAAYRRRRKRDKRKAFGLQMATVTLSATTTVLLGVRATGTAQERLADMALALSAIITVLAAAEAFFAHRGLWILRTETVRNLETFSRRLDYYQAGLDSQPPDPAAVDALHAQLDGILNADHTAWQHLRASTSTSAIPGTADTTAISTPPPAPSQ